MLNVKSKFLKKEIYEIGYGCGIGNYNNAKHSYKEVEKVIKSAIIWHGWYRSLNPFIKGTEEF